MVKIYWSEIFIDDYGLTISMETDLGLITILTSFPRRNKYITLRSVCALEIKPEIEIGHLETLDFHVRDIQTFTHQLLMKVEEVYPKNEVTKRIISEYRSKHGKA